MFLTPTVGNYKSHGVRVPFSGKIFIPCFAVPGKSVKKNCDGEINLQAACKVVKKNLHFSLLGKIWLTTHKEQM
jgi:hypothetical protein